MGLAAAALAVALAGTPVSYLTGRQQADGGFAEPGGHSSPELTAWATLGLAAAGRPPGAQTKLFLNRRVRDVGDVALKILALRAVGVRDTADADRLTPAPTGRIGPFVNSTIWSVLALRAAGVRGRAIRRGASYLMRFHNRDGGFELTPGRGSDSQSTAWAIQALLAAGRKPPASAFRYLRRMRRPNGSYRYSARYAVTPVWVTAQVLPALARKPFPIIPAPARSASAR